MSDSSARPADTSHPQHERPLMTAADVARVLNIGERTVWRLASRAKAGDGRFPKGLRIGPQVVRWRWRDVQDYLEELARK